VIVEPISSEELYVVKPKATCHITRQASINTHASVSTQSEQSSKQSYLWYKVYSFL